MPCEKLRLKSCGFSSYCSIGIVSATLTTATSALGGSHWHSPRDSSVDSNGRSHCRDGPCSPSHVRSTLALHAPTHAIPCDPQKLKHCPPQRLPNSSTTTVQSSHTDPTPGQRRSSHCSEASPGGTDGAGLGASCGPGETSFSENPAISMVISTARMMQTVQTAHVTDRRFQTSAMLGRGGPCGAHVAAVSSS